VVIEEGDRLGDDEAWRDIAPDDLGGLLRELRKEVR
jgi:hypothetical protein